MGHRLDRFVAGSSRPLQLASLGFAIALIGVLLALSIEYRPGNPLAYVAIGIAAAGFVTLFVAVGWGWWQILRGDWKKSPYDRR